MRGQPRERRPRDSRPTSRTHHQAAAVDGQIDRCEAEIVTAAPSNQPRPWYILNGGDCDLQLSRLARNHALRACRF